MKRLFLVFMMLCATQDTQAREFKVLNKTPWPFYVEFENSTLPGCYFHFAQGMVRENSSMVGGTDWECDGAGYKNVIIKLPGTLQALSYSIPRGIGYRREFGDQYIILKAVQDTDSDDNPIPDLYIVSVGVSDTSDGPTWATNTFYYEPSKNIASLGWSTAKIVYE